MTVPSDLLAVPVATGTGTLAVGGPDSALHSTFHAREATAIGVLQNIASFTLFDHYADSGNTHATNEIDLYSDTLVAGLLASNGDKIHAFYGGTWVAHITATRRVRVYFGGTVLLDSTGYASTNGGTFGATVELVRVSASVVRATVVAGLPAITAASPLPLLGAAYVEVTGQAGAAGAAINDIVAKQGYGQFIPAA